jgi:bifunctional N-acetylglucosamine-1-phosphate-uridyltransferase/glucosamine-1-phosphate-acetyltransferase GlmU-like protein
MPDSEDRDPQVHGQLPPVPFQSASGGENQEYARLLTARRAAVEAIVEAEDAEREAAKIRRKATRLRKTYERQLLEWNGQQRLPGT